MQVQKIATNRSLVRKALGPTICVRTRLRNQIRHPGSHYSVPPHIHQTALRTYTRNQSMYTFTYQAMSHRCRTVKCVTKTIQLRKKTATPLLSVYTDTKLHFYWLLAVFGLSHFGKNLLTVFGKWLEKNTWTIQRQTQEQENGENYLKRSITVFSLHTTLQCSNKKGWDGRKMYHTQFRAQKIWACVYSLSYPQHKAHASYYTLCVDSRVLPYFSTFSLKRQDFGKRHGT